MCFIYNYVCVFISVFFLRLCYRVVFAAVRETVFVDDVRAIKDFREISVMSAKTAPRYACQLCQWMMSLMMSSCDVCQDRTQVCLCSERLCDVVQACMQCICQHVFY